VHHSQSVGPHDYKDCDQHDDHCNDNHHQETGQAQVSEQLVRNDLAEIADAGRILQGTHHAWLEQTSGEGEMGQC